MDTARKSFLKIIDLLFSWFVDLKAADDSKRHLNLEMEAVYLFFFGDIRKSKDLASERGPQ